MDEVIEITNAYIKAIEQYSLEDLCKQPSNNSWSIGQLCVHLINDTYWFIDQIKICMATNTFVDEQMIESAKTMFINNSFPNERLTNPANANMPQPKNKEELLQSFIQLQSKLQIISKEITGIKSNGKTQHPGFGYFNASEWLQFAMMHLKHHFKQKEKIELFLKS